MVDRTINLISRSYHECERTKHYFSSFESTQELLSIKIDFEHPTNNKFPTE